MSKLKDTNDSESVTKYIRKLTPEIAEIVEKIRRIILNISPEIGERIKWNNPSCFYTGEMKPFDPKEYKREIVVFNLYKARIMLVFPSGAKVVETSGFLEGNYKDGRRTVVFKDLADVISKKNVLENVVKDWLNLVEK